MNYWQIAPEWKGETVFIVGGGLSFLAVDIEQLRGQRIIVINSSYRAVPFADFLIFSDHRWWEHNKAHLANWKGRIACLSATPREPHLLKLRRKVPPALNQPNDCLALQFTTATAAVDLASKLGAARAVLLGIDGKATDGKTHHHQPHPWRQVNGWEAKHKRDLQSMVEPMRQRGLEIMHGTVGSVYDFWPTVDLQSLLPRIMAVA